MPDALPDAERPSARLRPGTVLADRYRIESILGMGAYGVVWRARHVHLETECALKLFDPPLASEPQDAGARFLQEARVMARLKCPYVAQVFDYGVHDGMPFLVLELLPGKSLASHLDARREQGGRLTAAETARVIRNVAEALHVAHGARVVHRDLKPANIVLVPDKETYVAKVLDFGIAKWSADAAPSMTTTRTVMGTPHYMSPEQFESARQVDHRADLWSLGVIAFECLTGHLPFPGDSFIDVAFKVCREGPLVASVLSAVPAGFDAWFARATAPRTPKPEPHADAVGPRTASTSHSTVSPVATARATPTSVEPLAPSSEAPADGLELVADHVPPASTSTFDRVAAKSVLDEAAEKASHCRPAGDPTGEGRVRVTYEPSGRVASVAMLTSKFEDTAAGSCVLMLFRRARVPAFSGAFYVVVNKSFEIRP